MRCAPLALALGTALLLAPATLAARQADSARPPAKPGTGRARADTVVHLGAMRVTGTRLTSAVGERSPVRVDVLSTRAVPPGPAALPDALQRLPGVAVSDDQGTRVQPTIDLRGFSLSPVVGAPQGVSVFLDGVRINEPDAQQLNFDLVPMDAVDRAELVRGPGTIFGKNALAGALVLTTERGGAAPRNEASGEVGAFGYRAARVTTAGAHRGFDGYLMARSSDEDGWRAATPARTRMLFATLGRRGEESDLALSLLAAHDRAAQAGSLPESWLRVDRRANYTPGDFFEPRLLALTVRGERPFLGGQLRGNLFGRRNETEQFNVNIDGPSTRAFTGNRSLGATAEYTRVDRIGGAGVTLALGAEYGRSRVSYRILQEAGPTASIDSTCERGTGLCERARVDESDAAAYAQVMLDARAWLTLTASARADRVVVPFRDLRDPANDGTSTFHRVSPRIGVSVHPSERLRAHAALGTGFRAPAALELACADPEAPCPLPFALGEDPPLAPVTALSGEVGVEWHPIPSVEVALDGFRTLVRDEIVFVSSQLIAGYFQNIARSERRGVELTTHLSLPGGARAFASYAVVDATYRSAVQLASAIPDAPSVEPGDRFPLSPAHRASLGLGATRVVRGLVLDAELDARAVSSQFLRGDEANRRVPLAGYAVTGLRLSAEHRHLSVALHVTNLLGARYETFGVYARNPRGPLGGPMPAAPVPERFLTPGYPRAVTLAIRPRL